MKKITGYCFFILLSFLHLSLHSQRIATLEVNVKPSSVFSEFPVHVNLDALTMVADSSLTLYEIDGKGKSAVPFQIDHQHSRVLYWMVDPATGKSKRFYELATGREIPSGKNIQLKKTNGQLVIANNNRSLLRYNYATVYPPAGVDTVFKRSGFIHPLWSPHGQELTRISPPDHYHHFGLWNPWTKVLVGKDTVDFWNLSARKGTVRFANFVSEISGPVFGEYSVVHDHVVFKKNEEKVALHELQTVRIYPSPAGKDYYLTDITIQLNPATDEEIVLMEYRYGGLGWRATGEWNKDNSSTLTSEGKTRKDADGSKARWCIVQGSIQQDHAGIVMMSHPTNYNHPEPLRIWPESSNGRGDVYANFSPTKDKDWKLKKGQRYVLRYRLLVFNGKFTAEQAEAAWKAYATPASITIKK